MPNTAAKPDDIKPVPAADQVIAPAPQLYEFEGKRVIEETVIPELCTFLG